MNKAVWKITSAALAFLLIVLCPVRVMAKEAPVENHCRAYILVESETGQTLADHCADDCMPMASLTKMMTLLILFEAIDAGTIKLTDEITISRNAADIGGSQAFLDAGAQYPLDRLISSVIVGSANDSCVAIAEALAGSVEAFVLRMNERAQALGMTSTKFANPTGLPAEEHYSTARDLAKLSQALVHFPLYFEYSTTWIDQFEHPSGRQTMLANTNKLIRYGNGVDGIKTGFTNDAGFCLSASSERGGMRLIAVVLGGDSSKGRFNEAMELLEWGFANYEILRLDAPPEEVSMNVSVRGAKAEQISVEPEMPFCLLIEKGEDAQLRHEVRLPDSVNAPLAKGQTLGEWVVFRGEEEVGNIPLSATESVEKAGFGDFVKKIIDLWYGSKTTKEQTAVDPAQGEPDESAAPTQNAS